MKDDTKSDLDKIEEEVMKEDSYENELENQETDVKTTNKYPEKKDEKENFFSKALIKPIGNIGPLVGTLIVLVIIGFITLINVKDQVDDNSIKIQQDITESIHYIDLYEATGDERYLLYVYGELRSLDTLLAQTTPLSLSYPSIFFTPSKSDLSSVVRAHIQNFELSIDYNKNLEAQEIFQLRHQFKHALKATSPDNSFKDFIKDTNKAFR